MHGMHLEWTKRVLITEHVRLTDRCTRQLNNIEMINRERSALQGAPYLKSEEDMIMLKGIPKILSPELLMVLAEMGHSDRIVIADGNFPAESMGKDSIVIRCDGHGVPEILDAILQVFPLDTYVEKPVNLMQLMPGDVGKVETPIWDTYKEIVAKHDERGADAIGNIERFAFYDEAKTAYAIIATGESAIYANVMLQKGVVTD